MLRLSGFVGPLVMTCAVALAAAPTRAGSQAPQQPSQAQPSLDAILHAAAAYVDRLGAEAGGVVIEESYTQQVRVQVLTTRQLRSDMLLLADRDEGWIEFRDVFEVDGKPIRDRDDRLVKLFSQPNPDAREQARRIIAEGARFNLSVESIRISRTLNLPMTALRFLRTVNLPRSRFTRNGFTSIGDRRAAIVQFRETAKPRIIGSSDDAASAGTLWIDPDSGVVLRSEIELTTSRNRAQTKATIDVTFGLDAKSHLWLPREMTEHYDVTTDTSDATGDATSDVLGRRPAGTETSAQAGVLGTIEGRARYSNIRVFTVAVDDKPNGN